MSRKVAVAWHASFSIAAGVLYFFFVLPRWPELMGTTSHTLGTVLRIVTGALIGLAALPVVFTLLRTRKPELGTPQLALSLRTSSIGLHVLAGVLIIGDRDQRDLARAWTARALAVRHLRRRRRDRAARHLRVLPGVRGRAAAASAQTAQAEGGEEAASQAPQGRRRRGERRRPTEADRERRRGRGRGHRRRRRAVRSRGAGRVRGAGRGARRGASRGQRPKTPEDDADASRNPARRRNLPTEANGAESANGGLRNRRASGKISLRKRRRSRGGVAARRLASRRHGNNSLPRCNENPPPAESLHMARLHPVSPADRACRRDGTGGADPPGDRVCGAAGHCDRCRGTGRRADRHHDRLPARDRRGHRFPAQPRRRGSDQLPRGPGRRRHHRAQRRAPANRSGRTWSATTAHTTSPFCSCAEPRACPSRRWATPHRSPSGSPRWPSATPIRAARRRANRAAITRLDRTIDAKDALTGSSDELTGLIEVAANVRAGDSGGPLVNGAGPGDRRDHGRDGELPVRARRQGLRDPHQPGARHRRPDPVAGAVRHGAHRAAHAARRRRRRGRPERRRARRRHPRGACAAVPPQQAGLVDGDVLTSIDGAPLDSATALTRMLDRHYPGDVVDLTWIDRSGQQRTGKATLAS